MRSSDTVLQTNLSSVCFDCYREWLHSSFLLEISIFHFNPPFILPGEFNNRIYSFAQQKSRSNSDSMF